MANFASSSSARPATVTREAPTTDLSPPPQIAARLPTPIISVRPGLGRRGLFAARGPINNLNTFVDEFTIGGGIHRYIRFAIAAIT
jgi:hypothetical protein